MYDLDDDYVENYLDIKNIEDYLEELEKGINHNVDMSNFTLKNFKKAIEDDRRKLQVPRDELPQGSLNDQDFVVNAQTLINMARKRMCNCSHKETRKAFQAIVEEMYTVDPEMAAVMVPNCIYRGFCPEVKCCGFVNTPHYQTWLANYRNLKNEE